MLCTLRTAAVVHSVPVYTQGVFYIQYTVYHTVKQLDRHNNMLRVTYSVYTVYTSTAVLSVCVSALLLCTLCASL